MGRGRRPFLFLDSRDFSLRIQGPLQLDDERGLFLVLAPKSTLHERDAVLDGYLRDGGANHLPH